MFVENLGAPGARGPGARAPTALLLIRHWLLCVVNEIRTALDRRQGTVILALRLELVVA